MAGIGFELKKLFRRKGLFAWLRAYGYAGIICTGPMLLGIALQLGILLLCSWAGAERTQQDLLVCMVTYTLLSSLTVTSFFSMPVTRYLADMLYEEREDAILPSFWGSSVLMLLIGCILYGIFLLFSGATLLQGLLCLWLFAEMILNWNGMSYLTAIKDYRGILCSFLAAIGLAFGLAGVEGGFAGAAVLALGIGVQNLPEGLAVALPFRAGGMSRGRSFALGALSGAVEPVFGMLAALAAGMMQGALPGMMAFCAGAMMQVVFAEMAPQAAKSRAGLFMLMTGYALMMALDLALG